MKIIEGGSGSGNFGHKGRPGEVGGSASQIGVTKTNFKSTKVEMTGDDAIAINNYTHSSWWWINDYLRGKLPEPFAGVERDIQSLDKLTKSYEVLEPFWVFRGMPSKRNAKIGDTFIDNAFVSTTNKLSVADRFSRQDFKDTNPSGTLYRIKLDRGCTFLYIPTTIADEYVLPRNTKFRVSAISDGYVDLEIVK